MTQFIVRRLIQSFFLLLGITAVSFALQRLAPGGPETFTEDPRLPAEYRDIQRKEFGLDQPIPVQYAKWLWQAAHLNFGRSFTDKRPVWDKISERIPNTMILAGTSILIGFLGIPLGILAALRRNGLYDHTLRAATVVVNAVPQWWLGLVILVLTVKTGFRIFPLGGMYTIGNGSPLDRLHHLILPATILALDNWIVLSRFMRSEFLDVINQDYIRTARAKGLPRRVVMTRHALRNALIPVVTILGGSLAALLSVGVLVEYVFSWPGLGRLGWEAAQQRDYPVLMALTVIGATLVILGNLMADIAYGFVDPRIKYK
jgi:peptide/nickel transport system permease protein